jgi:hypothetical protein
MTRVPEGAEARSSWETPAAAGVCLVMHAGGSPEADPPHERRETSHEIPIQIACVRAHALPCCQRGALCAKVAYIRQ